MAERTVSKVLAKKVPKKPKNGLDPMQVGVISIMSKKVKTVRPDMSIEAAMDMMVQFEIGHLPVVDTDGKLVGLLSKTDLIRDHFIEGDTAQLDVRISGKNGVSYSPGSGFHEDRDLSKAVGDIMTKRVRTVNEGATIAEAAITMSKHRIHGLPVVSAKKSLVGFLSTFDIVDWVAAA
jgi:acetoin utilization protein AcuB